MNKTLIAAIAAVGIVGCAINRPYVQEKVEADGARTNYTRVVKGTSIALWPASQEVNNQKVSAGKTITVGTTGIGAEATGGTNGVATIQSLERIVNKLLP